MQEAVGSMKNTAPWNNGKRGIEKISSSLRERGDHCGESKEENCQTCQDSSSHYIPRASRF